MAENVCDILRRRFTLVSEDSAIPQIGNEKLWVKKQKDEIEKILGNY